jgi:hypothetical protein
MNHYTMNHLHYTMNHLHCKLQWKEQQRAQGDWQCPLLFFTCIGQTQACVWEQAQLGKSEDKGIPAIK